MDTNKLSLTVKFLILFLSSSYTYFHSAALTEFYPNVIYFICNDFLLFYHSILLKNCILKLNFIIFCDYIVLSVKGIFLSEYYQCKYHH